MRLAAVSAGLGILLYGTVRGTDDMFPFGPLVQYAFSVDPSGEIRSTFIEADTDDLRQKVTELVDSALGDVRVETLAVWDVP